MKLNVIVALIVFVTFSSELAAHPGTFVDTFCHASGGSYTNAGLSFVRIVWFAAAVGLGGMSTDIVGGGDGGDCDCDCDCDGDDGNGGSDSGDAGGGGGIPENVGGGDGVEIIRVEGVDNHVVDGVHDTELHTLALLDQTTTALSLLLLPTLPVTDEQSYAVVPVNVTTSVAVPASSWAATNA